MRVSGEKIEVERRLESLNSIRAHSACHLNSCIFLSHFQGQAVAEAALTCNLAYAEILTEEGDDADDEDDEDNTTLYCLTKRSGYAYRESIPSVLPAAFVEEHREAISAGTLKVSVASQYLVTDDNDVQTLVVPDQSIDALIVVRTSNNDIRERRRLSKEVRSGRKRLLAVRLLANGGTEVPPETLPDIRNAIFGSASTQNLPTVTSQYAAVSHGKLQIVPAQGPGIQDGVIEITMQASLATGNVSIQGPMLEDILRSTANALGDLDEVADHIIFCLPSGSLLNGKAKWTAFTYLYEPYSYYQRSRCTKLSVPMHELGHGVLGYKHSGKGRDRYADEQGYMGVSESGSREHILFIVCSSDLTCFSFWDCSMLPMCRMDLKKDSMLTNTGYRAGLTTGHSILERKS